VFARLWLALEDRLAQLRQAVDHLGSPDTLTDGDIDLLVWAADLPDVGWQIKVAMDLHGQGQHDLVPGLIDRIQAALLRLDDAE
jgi:hypothetical protein